MVNIKELLDDEKCFDAVRKLRWPDQVRCPHCNGEVSKRGMHSTQLGRQRYECRDCSRQFDDLTGSIFEGRHQPLRVWIVCSYMMGLNLSNRQIAAELDLNKDDVHAMTTILREGVEAKKNPLR